MRSINEILKNMAFNAERTNAKTALNDAKTAIKNGTFSPKDIATLPKTSELISSNVLNRFVKRNKEQNDQLTLSNKTTKSNNKSLFSTYTAYRQEAKEIYSKSANDLAKAVSYDNWTNSSEVEIKSEINDLYGEKIYDTDFKMFDFKAESYSSDLKEFAQNNITLYDKNNDDVLDIDEFMTMETAGQKNVTEEEKEILKETFKAFNLDKDTEHLDASELATLHYIGDVDWEGFAKARLKNPDISLVDFIDGKLSYNTLKASASQLPGDESYEIIQKERKDFYDNYYKDKKDGVEAEIYNTQALSDGAKELHNQALNYHSLSINKNNNNFKLLDLSYKIEESNKTYEKIKAQMANMTKMTKGNSIYQLFQNRIENYQLQEQANNLQAQNNNTPKFLSLSA